MSLQKKVELYDGVMTITAENSRRGNASASLEMLMMSTIPWKNPRIYSTINEVYFKFGITGLKGMGMLYLNHVKILHIPTSVTRLEDFKKLLDLETIYCDGVRNIGDYAFWNNNTIQDVVIAGSVTAIGEEAFYNTGITEVNIPASVTDIGKGAFESSSLLTTVYLTQNIDRLGRSVFEGCRKQ